MLELCYKSEKLRTLCTTPKAARRFFSGDNELAMRLLACINALHNAETLSDIIAVPRYRFHPLGKKQRDFRGCYAIDIKGRTSPWRLILMPLDENGNPMDESIDRIARRIKVLKIMEVSKHYE